MTLPAENTILIMTPMGVPLWSAGGINQTLTPTPSAKPAPKRTINGEARFLGGNQMRKYDSVITCTDLAAPAFGGLWPGDVITVHCVQELAYKTIGGSAERSVVAGSSYVEGAYTMYRPIIDFMVVDWENAFEEWEAENQWRLTLTEK